MINNNLYNNLILFVIGLTSGFTLLLSGGTLNFWLASVGINIKTIGIFALVTLPYSVNFLWAPIFDKFNIAYLSIKLGQKMSWLSIIQACLTLVIILISNIDPINNLSYFAVLGFLIAFFSSSQDCLLGALKTEIVSSKEQGQFAGIYVLGYRFGTLISGSLAIYLSGFLNFSIIYKYFAAVILLLSLILIFLIRKKKIILSSSSHIKFKNFLSILHPLGEFKLLVVILFFLILYRLPDNFLNIMISPFLLKLQFTTTQIAMAGKFAGFISVIIGGFIASHVMKNKEIVESLFLFGFIHAITHILFIFLDMVGNNLFLLYFVTICEGITSGMAMAAYITFITNLCSGQFKATQYSLLTAMMGVSRAIFPSISGYLVVTLGWKLFFIIIILTAIPSLYLLKYIKVNLKKDLR